MNFSLKGYFLFLNEAKQGSRYWYFQLFSGIPLDNELDSLSSENNVWLENEFGLSTWCQEVKRVYG